jgi:hypothetical protein
MIRRFTHVSGQFKGNANGTRVLYLEVDDRNPDHFRRVWSDGQIETSGGTTLRECLSNVEEGIWREIDWPSFRSVSTSETLIMGERYKITTIIEKI